MWLISPVAGMAWPGMGGLSGNRDGVSWRVQSLWGPGWRDNAWLDSAGDRLGGLSVAWFDVAGLSGSFFGVTLLGRALWCLGWRSQALWSPVWFCRALRYPGCRSPAWLCSKGPGLAWPDVACLSERRVCKARRGWAIRGQSCRGLAWPFSAGHRFAWPSSLIHRLAWSGRCRVLRG